MPGKERELVKRISDSGVCDEPNFFYSWTLSAIHGQQKLKITINTKSENAVRLSHNGKRIATATETFKVKVETIDPKVHFGKTLINLSGHEGVISAINYSYDDNLLITGSYDKTAIIWGVDENDKLTYGKKLGTLIGHTGFISDICFSNDLKLIITAGIVANKDKDTDGIIIWKVNFSQGNCKAIKKIFHKGQIKFMRLSNDSKLLSTLCESGVGYIWNTDLTSRNFGEQIVSLNRFTDWIRNYPKKVNKFSY